MADVQIASLKKVGVPSTYVLPSAAEFVLKCVNADDTRLTGGKYYAVLGWTLQTVCTTITLKGPSTGNNRVGLPGGALTLDTMYGFVELSKQFGKPLIPILNGYDAASYFLEASDGEASTSPKVDLFMYQLSSNPLP